ncbi:MAG: sigma-54 dependent transcriptional regulator [Rhodobacteraceae bacterium]|nr:sigma-54 dependent transcriptional regulator [Paracoccaceae bacterium]
MPSLEHRSIGLVEDDPLMGESLVQGLALEGLAVQWWRTGADALNALRSGARPEALICDIRLPDMNGEELFNAAPRPPTGLPFLFMTAFGDVDQAVRLIRSGASDYVTKPFQMEEFLDRLLALLPKLETSPSDPVLGVSNAMQEIDAFLQKIAGHSGPALISGETGVGKEICARRLHALSRPNKPFIAVNCAAIPADLLESELFGHEKGAFTGAHARHLGYAERAGEGVLFLDEIAEMPATLQTKLLRLIEARTFSRLGGEREVQFKARIIAATNQDIDSAVADGVFREDLRFRLDMFGVEVPPLRRRPEDIDWLLQKFVAMFERQRDRPFRGVGSLTVQAAQHHDWPGNVRELRNRVERAVALATSDWLAPSDLFPPSRGRTPGPITAPLAAIRDAAERRAIQGALRDADGHMQEAATLLGVSRTTLWEKVKRHGL